MDMQKGRSDLVNTIVGLLRPLLNDSQSALIVRVCERLAGSVKKCNLWKKTPHSLKWHIIPNDGSPELFLKWTDYPTREAIGLSILSIYPEAGCPAFYWGNENWVLTEWVRGESFDTGSEAHVRMAIERLLKIQAIPVTEVMRENLTCDPLGIRGEELVVSHGDYSMGNFLFNDEGLPTVVDWAGCTLRSRWYDLAMLLTGKGFSYSETICFLGYYCSLLGLNLDSVLTVFSDYLILSHISHAIASFDSENYAEACKSLHESYFAIANAMEG